MERIGICTDCGWCCERKEYYYFPEEYSANKAKILAYNESKTDQKFIKRISTWIEDYDSRKLERRVVKIEIGCNFFQWKYNNGNRKSFCKVYGDATVGCLYEKRIKYPESPIETPPNGMCGYKFKKEKNEL